MKPAICSQENVMGYVIRTRHFGTRCAIGQWRKLKNGELPRLCLAFPSGLQELAELHAPGLPDVDIVISDHTLYPFFSAFRPDGNRRVMRSHFSHGPHTGSWMATGLMSSGLRWRLATCLDCVMTDKADLGYSFWRNGHLVPALAVCPYHLTPLYTYCTGCALPIRRSRLQPLPAERCVCGAALEKIRDLRTAEQTELEVEISSAVRIILDGALSEMTSEDFRQAIYERSQASAPPQSCVRTYLAKLVNSRVQQETLAAYGVPSVSRRSALTRVGSGGLLSSNPFHNIFLILCLFGSVENLVKAIKLTAVPRKTAKELGHEEPAMKARASRLRALASSMIPFEEHRQRHRTVVLGRLGEFPELTRSELYARDRNTYDFMVWFDKEWVDVNVPLRRSRQKSTRRTEYEGRTKHDFDVSLSDHIYLRHKLFSQHALRTRLTHTRLVSGHPGESYVKKNFKGMPLVSLALRDCIETDEQWKTASSQMQGSSKSPVQQFDPNLFDLPTLPGTSDE